MSEKRVWTKEEIKQRLQENQNWLEQGIVAIFNKQTMSEQNDGDTHAHNNVGFSKPDAHRMTYYTNWILSGKHLSGKHLEQARKGMLKYAGQLTKIANKEI
jgi:hypothetical protein